MQQHTHIEKALTGFVATFGSGHSYRQCFVILYAETEAVAEQEMNKNHGSQWSGCLHRIEHFDFLRSPYNERYRCLAVLRQRIGEGRPYFMIEAPSGG